MMSPDARALLRECAAVREDRLDVEAGGAPLHLVVPHILRLLAATAVCDTLARGVRGRVHPTAGAA